jgi:hypothetical protein
VYDLETCDNSTESCGSSSSSTVHRLELDERTKDISMSQLDAMLSNDNRKDVVIRRTHAYGTRLNEDLLMNRCARALDCE